MVRRFLKHIVAPVRGLHQAAYLLAALTLASQLLALLRDRTFAHTFGAGQILDLYYAAFRMPDLIFALVSSLVSAYVLIPRITGMDREETRRLLSESATFLLAGGGFICIVIGIYMPQFLKLLYPDLTVAPYTSQFILLARLLLVQPILLGLTGVLASVTQVHRRFLLFSLSPLLYNLGIIFGTTILYPHFGLPGIGVGVVVGSIAYLAVHIPVLIDAGVMPQFRMPTVARMSSVVQYSIPRSLALGVNAFTILILTSMASGLGTGSISVFTFAGNLEAVPLALVGSSYAVAAFPAFSEALAAGKKEEFVRILSTSARHIILWSIVFLGIVAVLRAHIVRVILGTGAFDWNATRMTAALLVICMVGLVVDALELLFSRALYAAHQSWRPLMYQLAGGGFTIVLAIYFLHMPAQGFPAWLANFLKVGDINGTAILLLALANVIGQFFLVGLSLVALRGIAPGLSKSLVRPIIDGSIAALLGGLAAHVVLLLLGNIAPLTTLVAVFTQGTIAGVVGLSVAALALFMVGNEEILIMANAFDRLVRLPKDRAAALTPSDQEPIQP
jgi:putative peptidoglycan lipid II flippase